MSFIDLSHTLKNDFKSYPGDPEFSLKEIFEEDNVNYQNSFYVYGSLKTSDLAAQALNKIDSLQNSKFTSGGEYIKGTGIYLVWFES